MGIVHDYPVPHRHIQFLFGAIIQSSCLSLYQFSDIDLVVTEALRKASADAPVGIDGVAVTHGGYSTTAQMLLMGVRMLVCPEQLEQTIQAHRLNAQGLCQFASFLGKPGGVREKFDLAAGSAELGRNAAAFAARYAGYDSSRTVSGIVRECLEAAA